MLDKNKNYVGKRVDIYDTKFKEVNGKTARITRQGEDDRNNLVFELNISHPKDKNSQLWVKETEVKIL
jgi:hypothetical protein